MAADRFARKDALLLAGLLTMLALAGCLGAAEDPGPAASETSPRPAPSPATDPVNASIRLRVADINATAGTLIVDATGPENGTVELAWWPTGRDDRRQTRRIGMNASEVQIADLAPNRSYRFRGRISDGDGRVLAKASATQRTAGFPWADPVEALVRPGIEIDGSCTLAFLLTSSTNATVYGLTAGHCLSAENDGWVNAGSESGSRIGRVAVYEHGEGHHVQNRSEGEQHYYDWGLVRLLPNLRWATSPRVVNVTGPTGIADTSALQRGDRVCWEGKTPWLDRPGLRTFSQRCGRFASYVEGGENRTACRLTPEGSGGQDNCFDHEKGLNWFSWYGAVFWGDSGAPVLDAQTGRAIGIITNLNNRTSVQPLYDGTDEGPTLASILDRAAMLGYDLRLAQADYTEPGLA